MNEIEEKVKELKDAIKTIADLKTKSEDLATKLETLEKKGDSEQVKELQTKLEATEVELKKANTDIDNLDKSIKELSKKMEVKDTPQGYNEAVEKLMRSEEFKGAMDKVMNGERNSAKFEIKTDPTSVITSGATVPVARTMTGEIYSAGYIGNKFIDASTVRTVPQDKNRISWFDGTFTSNVGYISELTAIDSTSVDGAILAEAYRELAKIGSFMPFSRETTTDMSYFINWAQGEGKKAILSKVDSLILTGVGNSSAPTQVWGIVESGSTAFNASTAGLALAIDSANIGDLISACKTQIKLQSNESYAAAAIFMNPSDATKLRNTKDKNANYIGFLANGIMLLDGTPVYETARVTAGTLLVADISTFLLYQKAGIELEIERVAGTDSYVMYLRWRGNFVVPTEAKKGNVYVSNITTALAAITSVETTTTTTGA